MDRYIESFKEEGYDPLIDEKIAYAVQAILDGECKRVDVAPDIKVYECKNVIRIDLKMTGELDVQ